MVIGSQQLDDILHRLNDLERENENLKQLVFAKHKITLKREKRLYMHGDEERTMYKYYIGNLRYTKVMVYRVFKTNDVVKDSFGIEYDRDVYFRSSLGDVNRVLFDSLEEAEDCINSSFTGNSDDVIIVDIPEEKLPIAK